MNFPRSLDLAAIDLPKQYSVMLLDSEKLKKTKHFHWFFDKILTFKKIPNLQW